MCVSRMVFTIDAQLIDDFFTFLRQQLIKTSLMITQPTNVIKKNSLLVISNIIYLKNSTFNHLLKCQENVDSVIHVLDRELIKSCFSSSVMLSEHPFTAG